MKLISSTSELEVFCDKLASKPFVTVDTEFIRETTYWPQLCLIQAANSDISGMIDPLAEGIDLKPFIDLLTNKNVLKVMHGCRQDIEIFFNIAGIIPDPLFDTQVAAMACGFGDAVSYENLIKKTVGVKIDKGSRFTDWARRPLNDAQLSYALADVTHLRDAYTYLIAEIDKNDRMHWVKEEMQIILDPETYAQRPETAWKRLRMQDPRPRVLGVLVEISAWREIQAKERNTPRNRIMKDDALREIALQAPTDKTALTRLRAVPKGFENSRHADGLLEAIHKGLNLDPKLLPKLPPQTINKPGIGPLIDLLKVLLKQRCEDCNVAPKLVASVADLERIASDDEPDVPALTGWRLDVFGRYALDLKVGKLAMACEDEKVVLISR